MKFFETSAKDGTNVKDSFSALARDVVESMLAGGHISSAATGASNGGGSTEKTKTSGKKKDCVIA